MEWGCYHRVPAHGGSSRDLTIRMANDGYRHSIEFNRVQLGIVPKSSLASVPVCVCVCSWYLKAVVFVKKKKKMLCCVYTQNNTELTAMTFAGPIELTDSGRCIIQFNITPQAPTSVGSRKNPWVARRGRQESRWGHLPYLCQCVV